jgi:hypothetical protein
MFIFNFRFEQLPIETGLREESAKSDNIAFDSDPQNAVYNNLKSSKPKKIEKISQQSIYQKPRNLKEKSQKNKMNQNNNSSSIKHNGHNPVRVNSKEPKSGIEQPESNVSRIANAHKSASLKSNSTLKQTFLNNSILPNYG